VLVLIQNWSKNRLLGLITDYQTSCQQIFRIGTVRYAEGLWRMRRHGPVIVHSTDSEDFPTCHWKFIMIKCASYKKCDALYPFWGCRSVVAAVKRPTLFWLWTFCLFSEMAVTDQVMITVPHITQKYRWDCGLACSQMVLRLVVVDIVVVVVHVICYFCNNFCSMHVILPKVY